jgi:hypothetical protein
MKADSASGDTANLSMRNTEVLALDEKRVGVISWLPREKRARQAPDIRTLKPQVKLRSRGAT